MLECQAEDTFLNRMSWEYWKVVLSIYQMHFDEGVDPFEDDDVIDYHNPPDIPHDFIADKMWESDPMAGAPPWESQPITEDTIAATVQRFLSRKLRQVKRGERPPVDTML